jgi:hypothetical protein
MMKTINSIHLILVRAEINLKLGLELISNRKSNLSLDDDARNQSNN